MAVEWTGSGPDLLVRLDREQTEPLGAQLQRELRDAIRTGRLLPDERLPSSRLLAATLAVSRGVVVDCYAQLEAEGFLVSRAGSGTRVAVTPSPHATAPSPRPPATRVARPEIDFDYGVPDLARFPMRDWLWALEEAGRRMPVAELGDDAGAGSARLRTVLAAYLSRVRGALAAPDHIIVSSGFRHGVNLVFRALASPQTTHVALEDPGPTEHDTIALRNGLTPIPVPVDDRGLVVDALAATPARIVVVTPAHQCPSGTVLAPERRQALVEWARRVDGVIIEDDYDAEFRYDRRPVGSLQGLAPDHVVAMGTVSKTLASGVRLGWIVAPPSRLDAIVAEKQLAGRGAPALDQAALAALIESGRYDKHLRRMRVVYAGRRRALVEALAAHAPGVELQGLDAGCHAVLRLPAGVDERSVVEAAAARAIRFQGMSRYRADGSVEPAALVVGFGNVPEHAVRRGIGVLGQVLAELGA